MVLFHLGMRVRLTTTIHQPFAVQDVEGTVVGFDPDPADTCTVARLRSQASGHAGDFACNLMPKAIYVKLDDCELLFLPSAVDPRFGGVLVLPRALHRYHLLAHGVSHCHTVTHTGRRTPVAYAVLSRDLTREWWRRVARDSFIPSARSCSRR